MGEPVLLSAFKKAQNQACVFQVLDQDPSNLGHFPSLLVIPLIKKKKNSRFCLYGELPSFPNNFITHI